MDCLGSGDRNWRELSYKYAFDALVYYGEDIGTNIDRVARCCELLPASTDPFAALAIGAGDEFFDTCTEQATRETKAAEPRPAGAQSP